MSTFNKVFCLLGVICLAALAVMSTNEIASAIYMLALVIESNWYYNAVLASSAVVSQGKEE